MKTSKSPCMVAKIAYESAQQVFPLYRHKYSPKKFTQPQLFACLVLKSFWKTDYRGVIDQVSEYPTILQILELHHVPHYTTLHKASEHLLNAKDNQHIISNLLKLYESLSGETISEYPTVLIDSTGLNPERSSNYYAWRRSSGSNEKLPVFYRKYPKLSVGTLPYTMFILTGFVTQGPSTDFKYFPRLFKNLHKVVRPGIIIGDAGYDSESNHQIAHDRHVMSIIPCRSFRKDRPPKSPLRREMLTNFPGRQYGVRWHVETVMSMIKRNLGDKVYAFKFWAQSREIMLKVLTHDVMVVV